MWHAGIAMAAIHLSVSGEARHAQDADGNSTCYWKGNPYVARNHYYIIALEHFNKSIRLLSQALQSEQAAGRRYAIQEMAVMTNILYIGTASVLDDEHQIASHTKNLLRLLESFRFGDDDYDDSSHNHTPTPRRGIMAYDSLLSLVLALDGSFTQTADMPRRGRRSWTVKVPVYDSFDSVAQAYASILPLFCAALNDPDPALLAAGLLPTREERYLTLFQRFKRNMAAFRASSEASWSDEDRLSVAVMMQQLEVAEIKLAQESATRLQDVLRIERRYITALSRLATILSLQQQQCQHQQHQQLSPPSSPDAAWSPGQPFLSSLSFGTLLEYVATRVSNVEVQRQVVAMMKRWPYRESGARSHESVVFYETVAEHEKTGPARTRQLLVELSLETAAEAEATTPDSHGDGLLEHIRQCMEECNCIAGQFVCHHHKLADYHFNMKAERPYIELQNWFELTYEQPFTPYYL